MPFDPAKYLQGFGWDSSKGLGKNGMLNFVCARQRNAATLVESWFCCVCTEDGALNFVKVVKKDDTAGIGSREDWTVQSRFSDDLNKSLKSINIVVNGDEVMMVKRGHDSSDDGSSDSDAEAQKLVHNGAFRKSDFVLNDETVISNNEVQPAHLKQSKQHHIPESVAPGKKVARDGEGVYSSRVAGKLARVMRQEKEFMSPVAAAPVIKGKYMAPVQSFSSFATASKSESKSTSQSNADDEAEQKRLKKEAKRQARLAAEQAAEPAATEPVEQADEELSKAERKARRRALREAEAEAAAAEAEEEERARRNAEKKARKQAEESESQEPHASKKSKKV
jgi:hypothetical protein